MTVSVPAPWWQRGVLYQIYPRSFQDANDDGTGDLAGILERLPYLRDLGVDALWLSPIFPSPMADFGYDISNYVDVDPLFGTLADLDTLIARAHAQGLKILLDLVPNHTSDRHPWFVEARAARSSERRDWYIWRDPAPDGGPPNNWLSEFGGSAWEKDNATGQYYYHAFLAAQPDLNWRNSAVRHAMYDVMRFWLARGVDGFRVDVIWHLIKDDQFRDNPPNPSYAPGQPPHERLAPLYTTDRPEVLDVIAEMRKVVDEFDDRVLIGEIYLPVERLVAYYGRDLRGLHVPFNFALLRAPWTAAVIAGLIGQYERALPHGGWPNWVLGNHDRMRVASRVGAAQARIAAMLLFTLRGTPTLYYGDEIGMQQVAIPPRLVQDPVEKNLPGLGLGRDGCRTPMQWDAGIQAGFSRVRPWLPVGDDFRIRNVVAERDDAASLLNLHRDLVRLRRDRDVLVFGEYRRLEATDGALVYDRAMGEDWMLVALNFTDRPVKVAAPADLAGRIVISTDPARDAQPVGRWLELGPNEGIVVEKLT